MYDGRRRRMPRAPLGLLTGLALLLPAPARPGEHHKPPAPAAPAPPPAPPPVPRGSTEPDANALPAVAPDALLPAGPVPRYRLLREPDAQCLAAQYAWLANLLDQERAALAAEHA